MERERRCRALIIPGVRGGRWAVSIPVLVRLLHRKRWTLGYAAQSTEFAFSREVTESIRRAAVREQVIGLSLTTATPAKPHRAMRSLIESRVSLVMEFQTDHRIAAILSDLDALIASIEPFKNWLCAGI